VSVDPASYRDPAELALAMRGDPIARAREPLLAAGVSEAAIEEVMREACDEVAAAVASADAAPWPEPGAAYEDIQDTGSGRWRN
jgi:pyruvate dehydrogenase E1 component alpha subunit